jgi:hypothetical protein
VYWDTARFLSEKQKKAAIEIDESVSAIHSIGSTNFVYAVNPVWEQMVESDNAKRLRALMPSQGAFFDQSKTEDSDTFVDFPILQPIGVSSDLQCLEPWESSSAAVILQVQFADLLNVLPGSEYALGEGTQNVHQK